jgi:hypothetical protein
MLDDIHLLAKKMIKMDEKSLLYIIQDELNEMNKERKNPRKHVHYLVKNSTLRYMTENEIEKLQTFNIIYKIVNEFVEFNFLKSHEHEFTLCTTCGKKFPNDGSLDCLSHEIECGREYNKTLKELYEIKKRDEKIVILIDTEWNESELQDREAIIRNAERCFEQIKKLVLKK